jgi:predicted dehydrogenase
MGQDLTEAKAIVDVAGSLPNLVGYNYIQTPATALAKSLLEDGAIGEIIWYRGEHHEDFLVDADCNEWRKIGDANGTLGDLMPHPIHCALTLAGPIQSVVAD